MKKIGVLGAGSWGTALTWLLTNNGHEVTLWSIMEAEVEMLRTKREHTSKLPGVKLQESIQLTSNLEEAMADKDVLVLAVPSPYTRSTAQKMAPYLKKGQIVVNVAKGVEEHTLMTLSQIIEEELPEANVAVLSGPEPCGRGWKRSSDNLCCGSENETDSRISAGNLHESGFPCLHKSGCSWYRTGSGL